MNRREFCKLMLATIALPSVALAAVDSQQQKIERDQQYTFVFGRQLPKIEIPMDHIPIGEYIGAGYRTGR